MTDDEEFSWRYQRYIKDYLRVVAAIDDGVGRTLDWLDANAESEPAAITVFAVILILTRMFQRVLGERLLPRTRFDVGVRNSLSTGFGYLGVILAVALGIAALGLDLSNLAIIAGALSVGASVADNTIGNSVLAQIDNSTVESTAGNVVVLAESQATIDALALAGSIAVAKGSNALALSGAGTGSYNTIVNAVSASISGGADVDGQSVPLATLQLCLSAGRCTPPYDLRSNPMGNRSGRYDSPETNQSGGSRARHGP